MTKIKQPAGGRAFRVAADLSETKDVTESDAASAQDKAAENKGKEQGLGDLVLTYSNAKTVGDALHEVSPGHLPAASDASVFASEADAGQRAQKALAGQKKPKLKARKKPKKAKGGKAEVKKQKRAQRDKANAHRRNSAKTQRRIQQKRARFSRRRVPRAKMSKLKILKGAGRVAGKVLTVATLGLTAKNAYDDSLATSQVEKLVDAAAQTGLSATIAYAEGLGPLNVALAAEAIFIDDPEKKILSGTLNGGISSYVTLSDAVWTGNSSGLEAMQQKNLSGRNGYVLKKAAEAGDFWAEKGLSGGLRAFGNEVQDCWSSL